MKRPRTARGAILLITGAVVVGGLLSVRIVIGPQGPDYRGPLLLLDHFFDLAAVLALLSLCAAVGRFILSRSGTSIEQPLEALLFGTAFGAGIIATGILMVGLAAGVNTAVLLVLTLLLALLARKELGELPDLAARAVSTVRQQRTDRGYLAFGFLVFSAVGLFLIIVALAPPTDWDALMYHLEVPADFLRLGHIQLPEDNLHAAFVGLPHMLYLLLLALGSTSGPALLSACIALLLGLTVFAFCDRLLNRATAGLSLALLWGTTTILLVAITPRVDVTLGLFLFIAHYALFLALTEEGSHRFLYVSAACLGFAFGVKYQAIPYIAALGPLVLWVVLSRSTGLRAGVRPIIVFALLVFVCSFPWLLKNFILLGAPVYPFLARRALEPWLVPLYGTATVPESINAEIFRGLASVRVPFNLRDAFLAPGRVTVEAEGAFYYANPILVALPLWLIFFRNRNVSWLILPAVGFLAILIVPFPATNLRYLVPAAAPLTVATVVMMVRVSQRFLSARAAQILLIGLAVLALIPTGKTAHAWLVNTKALEYLAGSASAQEYLASHIDPSVRVYAPLVQFVNDKLPRDSHILMLFEARSFYLERSTIQDNRLSNWPLLAPKLETNNCAEPDGISHVLLALGSLRYYVQRGLDLEAFQWGDFLSFAEQCLAPVYEGPGFVVFQPK